MVKRFFCSSKGSGDIHQKRSLNKQLDSCFCESLHVSSLQTLTKGDEFDKSLITTTTTTKSILRPLPQYLLAVKNVQNITDELWKNVQKFA